MYYFSLGICYIVLEEPKPAIYWAHILNDFFMRVNKSKASHNIKFHSSSSSLPHLQIQNPLATERLTQADWSSAKIGSRSCHSLKGCRFTPLFRFTSGLSCTTCSPSKSSPQRTSTALLNVFTTGRWIIGSLRFFCSSVIVKSVPNALFDVVCGA